MTSDGQGRRQGRSAGLVTGTPSDTETRRARLRELLGISDGFAPAPGRTPRVCGADPQRPPTGVSQVQVDTGSGTGPGAGAEIPAFLLGPDPERANGAAVVLVAGHGRGIDDLVHSGSTEEGLAHKMARAGFTVLCPEMISFGRRRFPRPEGAAPYAGIENACRIDVARHVLYGRPVMGHRVADARAAVRALRDVPGVDPHRVGVAGGSGGGAVSLLLAASDPTISAALVAAYFCTFEASFCSLSHCPCNMIPGVLPEFEMADIAALIAPRPLIIEAGEHDHIFPIEATRASFDLLPPVWHAQAAEPPGLVVTDSGHAFRAEKSLEALVGRLG